MARPKKIKEIKASAVAPVHVCCQQPEKTEKEKLIELYEFMKSRGIYSIGTLENLIANYK